MRTTPAGPSAHGMRNEPATRSPRERDPGATKTRRIFTGPAISPRRDCGSQPQRRIDGFQPLERAADAAHGDVAVVEQPPKQRLIDVDALDLLHVHLDGMPADQAAFENDAAI